MLRNECITKVNLSIFFNCEFYADNKQFEVISFHILKRYRQKLREGALEGFFKYQYEYNSRLLIKLLIVNWQGYL